MVPESIDVTKVDRTTLRDINSVRIDMDLPCEERMQNFVKQIENPYCYTDGELVIGIGYAETDVSLKEKLAIYACGLG